MYGTRKNKFIHVNTQFFIAIVAKYCITLQISYVWLLNLYYYQFQCNVSLYMSTYIHPQVLPIIHNLNCQKMLTESQIYISFFFHMYSCSTHKSLSSLVGEKLKQLNKWSHGFVGYTASKQVDKWMSDTVTKKRLDWVRESDYKTMYQLERLHRL